MTTIRIPNIDVARVLAGVVPAEQFLAAVNKTAAREDATNVCLPEEARQIVNGDTISVEKTVTKRTPLGPKQATKRWSATVTYTGALPANLVAGVKVGAEIGAARANERIAKVNAPAKPKKNRKPKKPTSAYPADAFVAQKRMKDGTPLLAAVAAGSVGATKKLALAVKVREVTKLVLPESAASAFAENAKELGVEIIIGGTLPQKLIDDISAKVAEAKARYESKGKGNGNARNNRSGGTMRGGIGGGIGSAGKTARKGGKAAALAKKAEKQARDRELRNKMRGDSNKKD